MKAELTLDSAGRIVLPSAVRRALNLSAGSRLRLDVVAQRIELTPAPDTDTDTDTVLEVEAGKRTVLRATGKVSSAAAAVRAERDALADRAGKRPA